MLQEDGFGKFVQRPGSRGRDRHRPRRHHVPVGGALRSERPYERAVLVEDLDPEVVRVGDVDRSIGTDLNPVRVLELQRRHSEPADRPFEEAVVVELLHQVVVGVDDDDVTIAGIGRQETRVVEEVGTPAAGTRVANQ